MVTAQKDRHLTAAGAFCIRSRRVHSPQANRTCAERWIPPWSGRHPLADVERHSRFAQIGL